VLEAGVAVGWPGAAAVVGWAVSPAPGVAVGSAADPQAMANNKIASMDRYNIALGFLKIRVMALTSTAKCCPRLPPVSARPMATIVLRNTYKHAQNCQVKHSIHSLEIVSCLPGENLGTSLLPFILFVKVNRQKISGQSQLTL
jgi:hypothetical protein